ncbi:Synaptic vesicular amine transporter [Fragariocoptes setiger]|uniref:Synaptic vesicular amine transporter n=1 Tax=Fragariocoptes setiger TaxID=1670756 RepID=A0ABQ7S9D4_9ACAR|nr:Synaptic vesicular amine transporter [Fragariocoptes setiger]
MSTDHTSEPIITTTTTSEGASTKQGQQQQHHFRSSADILFENKQRQQQLNQHESFSLLQQRQQQSLKEWADHPAAQVKTNVTTPLSSLKSRSMQSNSSTSTTATKTVRQPTMQQSSSSSLSERTHRNPFGSQDVADLELPVTQPTTDSKQQSFEKLLNVDESSKQNASAQQNKRMSEPSSAVSIDKDNKKNSCKDKSGPARPPKPTNLYPKAAQQNNISGKDEDLGAKTVSWAYPSQPSGGKPIMSPSGGGGGGYPNGNESYVEKCTRMLQECRTSRKLIIVIVAIALLLDNMLLTSVVPIIPAYLYKLRIERQNLDALQGKAERALVGGRNQSTEATQFRAYKNASRIRLPFDDQRANKGQTNKWTIGRQTQRPVITSTEYEEASNEDRNNDLIGLTDLQKLLTKLNGTSNVCLQVNGKKVCLGKNSPAITSEQTDNNDEMNKPNLMKMTKNNSNDENDDDDDGEEDRKKNGNVSRKEGLVVMSDDSDNNGPPIDDDRSNDDDDDGGDAAYNDDSFGRKKNINVQNDDDDNGDDGDDDDESNNNNNNNDDKDNDDERSEQRPRLMGQRPRMKDQIQRETKQSSNTNGRFNNSKNKAHNKQQQQWLSKRSERFISQLLPLVASGNNNDHVGVLDRKTRAAQVKVQRIRPSNRAEQLSNNNEDASTTTTSKPELKKVSDGGDNVVISHQDLVDENFEVGIMFASKPIVQAIANPFIGTLTNKVGFSIPMFTGFVILFLSTLTFAMGSTFSTLFMARALQGVGSACTSVAGMSMLADRFPDDRERGNAMAIALGGLALGVVIGPPFGGIMYEFVGKASPFIVLSFLAMFDGLLQLMVLQPRITESPTEGASLMTLIKDPYILVAAGAITFANVGIAILEPSLPLWMIDTMNASNWKQGAAFLPAAISYLIGTNMFGNLGHRMGRWLASMIALIVIGLSLLMIPFARSLDDLIVPNGAIGFAMGMVDSTMMPMLGYLVDIRHTSVYGSVYAIGDVAFCAAFAIGPALSGTLVELFGFETLVTTTAIICFSFAPLLLLLRDPPGRADVLVPSEEQSALRYVNYANLDSPDEETELTGKAGPIWVR